ncbi:MAG: hypothetical protein Q4F07_06910 [Bacteroidales bacterium]|nr:hypothetical protein [Bacteroidales bacterium]
MKHNSLITQTTKYLKYILAISFAIVICGRIDACGPYYPDNPGYLKIFRSCSPELERQWQEGCRFQDYEKEQNCLLWQRITSPSIPVDDIEKIVYSARLSELKDLTGETLADNTFAQWLSEPEHKEDLDYILVAKEIEEIREYMNNPWYYAYDGDEEHLRLDELMNICQVYAGKRHAARYALQMVRLYFATGDFKSCRELWETSISGMKQDIVTDMIASYAGGAYVRDGNREKAIELFTRSQDIGSLISLKAWNDMEVESEYTDKRVMELEYVFNRFPNSPLLSIKLQEYVRNRESFVSNFDEWKNRDFHDPVPVKYKWINDSVVADDKRDFYNELMLFARKAISARECHQKAMWQYALGYLYYLDGNLREAQAYLKQAEHSDATPFIRESIRAFRFLMDARNANNSHAYHSKLLRDLKWLDEHMKNDATLNHNTNWQYDNKMNWPVCYWQDMARRVLLGDVCPRMEKAGNTTLALQLANYATNRIFQISPLYEAYHYGWYDKDDPESYTVVLPFEEYRETWSDRNYFDFQSQFFEWIYGSKADEAAKYAERIVKPTSDLERFLNERSYVEADYINEIVGTLYLREMNYEKASEWLAKVSEDYQSRTNIAKEGYFNLDPFRYQYNQEQLISDSSDYKLRFAQEMVRLENLINSDAEVNRKADAKIRYAIGLRNSFVICWYLTQYGYNLGYESDYKNNYWPSYSSIDRKGFKGNDFAQNAYKKVDALMEEAIEEFTDPEKAAQAQLEMMNYATLMVQYPTTKAAEYIRTRCDNYYDYALQCR